MQMSEELSAWISKARKGDQKAFDDLYSKYWPAVLFACNKLCIDKEDAKEALQDTFFKAFTSMRQLKDDNRFKPWLLSIAVNQCYTKLRKKQLATSSEDSVIYSIEETDEDYLPELYVERKETSDFLIEVIDSLPAKQREVIYMHYYADMKIEDIAKIQDCSIDSVKNALFLGRKNMKERIENDSRGAHVVSRAGVPLAAVMAAAEESYAEQATDFAAEASYAAVTKAMQAAKMTSYLTGIASMAALVCTVAVIAVIWDNSTPEHYSNAAGAPVDSGLYVASAEVNHGYPEDVSCEGYAEAQGGAANEAPGQPGQPSPQPEQPDQPDQRVSAPTGTGLSDGRGTAQAGTANGRATENEAEAAFAPEAVPEAREAETPGTEPNRINGLADAGPEQGTVTTPGQGAGMVNGATANQGTEAVDRTAPGQGAGNETAATGNQPGAANETGAGAGSGTGQGNGAPSQGTGGQGGTTTGTGTGGGGSGSGTTTGPEPPIHQPLLGTITVENNLSLAATSFNYLVEEFGGDVDRMLYELSGVRAYGSNGWPTANYNYNVTRPALPAVNGDQFSIEFALTGYPDAQTATFVIRVENYISISN